MKIVLVIHVCKHICSIHQANYCSKANTKESIILYLFSRSWSTIETNASFGPSESHAFIQVRIIAVNGNGSTSGVKNMVLQNEKKKILVSFIRQLFWGAATILVKEVRYLSLSFLIFLMMTLITTLENDKK